MDLRQRQPRDFVGAHLVFKTPSGVLQSGVLRSVHRGRLHGQAIELAGIELDQPRPSGSTKDGYFQGTCILECKPGHGFICEEGALLGKIKRVRGERQEQWLCECCSFTNTCLAVASYAEYMALDKDQLADLLRCRKCSATRVWFCPHESCAGNGPLEIATFDGDTVFETMCCPDCRRPPVPSWGCPVCDAPNTGEFCSTCDPDGTQSPARDTIMLLLWATNAAGLPALPAEVPKRFNKRRPSPGPRPDSTIHAIEDHSKPFSGGLGFPDQSKPYNGSIGFADQSKPYNGSIGFADHMSGIGPHSRPGSPGGWRSRPGTPGDRGRPRPGTPGDRGRSRPGTPGDRGRPRPGTPGERPQSTTPSGNRLGGDWRSPRGRTSSVPPSMRRPVGTRDAPLPGVSRETPRLSSASPTKGQPPSPAASLPWGPATPRLGAPTAVAPPSTPSSSKTSALLAASMAQLRASLQAVHLAFETITESPSVVPAADSQAAVKEALAISKQLHDAAKGCLVAVQGGGDAAPWSPPPTPAGVPSPTPGALAVPRTPGVGAQASTRAPSGTTEPLFTPRLGFHHLVEEHNNQPAILSAIPILEKRYGHWRAVHDDGNSYYRAVFIAFLEHCIQGRDGGSVVSLCERLETVSESEPVREWLASNFAKPLLTQGSTLRCVEVLDTSLAEHHRFDRMVVLALRRKTAEYIRARSGIPQRDGMTWDDELRLSTSSTGPIGDLIRDNVLSMGVPPVPCVERACMQALGICVRTIDISGDRIAVVTQNGAPYPTPNCNLLRQANGQCDALVPVNAKTRRSPHGSPGEVSSELD